jgi:hypothetical protein
MDVFPGPLPPPENLNHPGKAASGGLPGTLRSKRDKLRGLNFYHFRLSRNGVAVYSYP